MVGVAVSAASTNGVDPELVHRLVAQRSYADGGMVASSSSLANRVGIEILSAGGNAVDAAVAMAIALGACDPGDSGIGGATYILLRMADGTAAAIDGSARVPLVVSRPALKEIYDAGQKYGPELAATPGTLAALELARERFGTMTFRRLVEPSIAIAEAGYQLTPFQRASIARYPDDVRASASLMPIVMDEHENPKAVGTLIRWPGHADVLRALADGGVDAFYRGTVADAIERDMERIGGYVRRPDLALMRARVLEPLRGTYRGYEILAFPPPGSGAAVIEGLNILEDLPAEELGVASVPVLQHRIEAFRIAIRDHRGLMPNPEAPVSAQDLSYIEKAYAAGRAGLISFGGPVPDEVFFHGPARPELDSETVQVSVIDGAGNAVALTQSLGRFFGNKWVAHRMGFIYNTFLGGVDPSNPHVLRPKQIVPSDGAPTIVVSGGRPVIVLGSSGSTRIPGAVATVISNVVDLGMSLSEAIEAPRILWSLGASSRGMLVEIAPPIDEAAICALEEMGYRIGLDVRFPAIYLQLTKLGGVNAVYRDPATGRLEGVGDPRRSGRAQGLD